MNYRSYKEESKKPWGRNMVDDTDTLTTKEIELGAILRIADSMEKMCVDRVQLERDLDWYKKRCQTLTQEIEKLNRSKASYIGKLRSAKAEIANIKENMK